MRPVYRVWHCIGVEHVKYPNAYGHLKDGYMVYGSFAPFDFSGDIVGSRVFSIWISSNVDRSRLAPGGWYYFSYDDYGNVTAINLAE